MGDLTDELIHTDVWTDDMVARAGIPIGDVPFVSVGGGIGSFVLVDMLRIAGVPTSDIKVLSNISAPWQTYEYLTRCSQIPRTERLRSDSQSCPDNPWGFPSYALREGWTEKTLKPIWNVLTEPILNDYWTPRGGTVFKGMEREAERISWFDMAVKGQVRMVRRRAGGGYFTILTPPQGVTPTKRVAYRSRWVHLAVGYPGLRYLPDLQEYRTRYPSDQKVVNAYEPHEHVYADLARSPGVVVIRGAGIVASRVLQRLIDDRDRLGLNTQILHLFRTYVTGPHNPDQFGAKRPGANGWAHQGFNWPKGSWGGWHKQQSTRKEGEELAKMYDISGGTTTPKRKDWKAQLKRGREEQWYKVYVGTVESVVPDGDHVITRMRDHNTGAMLEVPADYVIDCTGLEADVKNHRVLRDLFEHSGAQPNVRGKLQTETTYEVRGTRSGDGRLYATGSMTLGSYQLVVDSFLGLQMTGLEVVDDLARQGFGKKIGPIRSTLGWLKWATNSKLK